LLSCSYRNFHMSQYRRKAIYYVFPWSPFSFLILLILASLAMMPLSCFYLVRFLLHSMTTIFEIELFWNFLREKNRCHNWSLTLKWNDL
jgi:hypothetical protein